MSSRPGITFVVTSGGVAMSWPSRAPPSISASGEAVACDDALGTVAPTAVRATQIAKRFMSHSRHRDGAGLPLAGDCVGRPISGHVDTICGIAPLQRDLCKSLLAK